MAGRFLKDADVEEVLALAHAWELTVNDLAPANAWELLLGSLVAFDPDGALDLGQRLKANGYYDNFAGFILQTWFTLDPVAALAHAETGPGRLLPLIIEEVARRDMAQALDLSHRHPSIPALAQHVLPELGKTDPLGAMDRAEGIADVRINTPTPHAGQAGC